MLCIWEANRLQSVLHTSAYVKDTFVWVRLRCSDCLDFIKRLVSNHVIAWVPDRHRHYSCWPRDKLHLVIEHFQWPLHGPWMLCWIIHCIQTRDKNAAVSGIFQRWPNMTVPVVTVAVTADVISDIAVCTAPLQHFCNSVTSISTCITIIITIIRRSVNDVPDQ